MMKYKDAMRAQYYLPALDTACQRLSDYLDTQVASSDVRLMLSESVQSIRKHMADTADQMLLPAIAYEIHRAKEAGQLTGTSPQARYKSFFMQQGAWTQMARHLVRKYAPLFQSMRLFFESTIDNIVECLARLADDRSELEAWRGHPPGALTTIEIAGGDRHQDGRQVVILGFEHDKLVYKPSSLAAHHVFNDFVEMLSLDAPYNMRCLDVYSKDHYGWMEYVDFRPCQTAADVRDFYRRAGALLAIVDALNYCDGHFENLIAHGAYPVLIDCETLFHSFDEMDEPELGERSVFYTGLVQPLTEDVDKKRGLSAAFQVQGTRRSQLLYTHPIHERTDALQVRFRGINNGIAHNAPVYEGTYHVAAASVDALCEGYRYGFDTLLNHREAILRHTDWWDRLAATRVRQLIRHTMYYLYLIRRMQQPEMIQEPERVRAFLSELLNVEADKANQLVEYEVDDLLTLNIPYFTHYPASRDLIDATGEVYTDYFAVSASDQIRNHLKSWDTAYRDRQIELLRHHLVVRPTGADNVSAESAG